MFNLPPKLRAELHSIEGRIEEAIRQDERQKLLQQLAKEGGDLKEQIRQELYQKHLTAIADVFADRNGKQTQSSGDRTKPNSKLGRDRPKPNSKLGRLFGCLASRTYAVNRDTLVRLSGMTPVSVHQGIQELRQRGYTIECNRQGTKPKYKMVA